MNWLPLNSLTQLEELTQASKENLVLIYKHSTRCSTSKIALDRLNRNYKPGELDGIKTYFLDLISHRDVSNAVAQRFGVEHESPQAILVKGGKAVYSASHLEIDYERIRRAVQPEVENRLTQTKSY